MLEKCRNGNIYLTKFCFFCRCDCISFTEFNHGWMVEWLSSTSLHLLCVFNLKEPECPLPLLQGTPHFGENFRGLVLGCMGTYDSESRRIFSHFSRSTRFAFLCTAQISNFQQKLREKLLLLFFCAARIRQSSAKTEKRWKPEIFHEIFKILSFLSKMLMNFAQNFTNRSEIFWENRENNHSTYRFAEHFLSSYFANSNLKFQNSLIIFQNWWRILFFISSFHHFNFLLGYVSWLIAKKAKWRTVARATDPADGPGRLSAIASRAPL